MKKSVGQKKKKPPSASFARFLPSFYARLQTPSGKKWESE